MGRYSTVAASLRPTVSGRYELGRELARGGMGAILHAVDRFTSREVAYKRLIVRDERSRARVTALFQREYETLARLAHPNIVEVYDYGLDAEGPYYVMELLPGDDLTKLAPLPYREACRLLRDVASALALVHGRRLIHRDVSPGNVRITTDGHAKLIDFGALMPFGRAKELVGTPACMAPECLADAPLDQRSDLYSLGAVAYWLLTRHSAVPARVIEDLEEAWATPLLPPSMYVAELPRELDELVLSLLARDPLARPASAAYVIERLTTIADLPPELDERRVAYGYLAHPALVGRKEVRAALAKAIDEALESRGSALLIEAAAGLGRSALLDEVALHGQLAGATVLRADGDPGAQSFALARKLVKDLYALYPDLEDQVATCESFQSFRPDTKLTRVRSPMEIATRHAQVIASVQETIVAAAKRAPLMIVVDDLHEADEESRALLASLAQSASSKPIALIASASSGRSEERSPAFTNFEGSALRLPLGTLSDEEIVELVTYVFGNVPNTTRLAQWLKEQSGGNPSTLMDLARLLLQRGSIRYTLGTFALPNDPSGDLTQEELARANLARLGDLSERAQRIATVLSLHEGALTATQLGHAVEASQGEIALALEELAARDVAVQSEQGVVLSSASLTAALQRALGEERKALHERIARALLAEPTSEIELLLGACQHLLEAGLEEEAADLVRTKVRTDGLDGAVGARFTNTFERVLAVYRRQKRSKEACLSVLLPITRAGFYGDPRVAQRYTELTLRWMSLVCGMTLARALRPYVGGKLALLFGLLYASIRRATKPASERLGSVKVMLANFLGSGASSIAAAASSLDSAGARRVLAILEPFQALKPESAGGLLYEFSAATTQLSSGDAEQAIARYTRLIPLVKNPLPDVDANLAEGIYRGSLNGCAQAAASAGSPRALELADQLAGNPFFAPHAECARMTHYGYRGQREKAAEHRARAELLALRGGTSWTATTVLAVRAMYIAIFSQDPIALLQALSEIERFIPIAPKLRTLKALGEACLEQLRGKPERAVALYERVIYTDDARQLASWLVDRGMFAGALNAAGKYERAKEVCLELLGPPPYKGDVGGRVLVPQLALAEAGLGQHALAAELLDRHIVALQELDNPLELGGAHRDRAKVATMMGDKPAYERHFEEMKRCFSMTQNSTLISQLDVTESAAQRSGLTTSSGRILHSRSFDEFDSTTVIEQQETQERPTVVREVR